MSKLFSSLKLGGLVLKNRIVVAPMCQYSGDGAGNCTEWHHAHLASMALSGAGLLVTEAVAVTAEGRISPYDVGLYSDANERALESTLRTVRACTPPATAPFIALQLGHAGRKGSGAAPWRGGAQISPEDPEGWQTLAPSAIPHAPHEHAPLELDSEGLDRIERAFADAAVRAERLGIDGLELHSAHGYLMHEFVSPISNRRTDEYGGSIENRIRFPLRIFKAVRSVFPAEKPVWIRISASDFVDGGLTEEDIAFYCKALEEAGCAAIHVSAGGISPNQKIEVGPGYQVPLAAMVKKAVKVPVIAVGMITDARQAEQILVDGHADAVALARALLWNPRWPWHAAAELGASVDAPPQYFRSIPHGVDKTVFNDLAHSQR